MLIGPPGGGKSVRSRSDRVAKGRHDLRVEFGRGFSCPIGAESAQGTRRAKKVEGVSSLNGSGCMYIIAINGQLGWDNLGNTGNGLLAIRDEDYGIPKLAEHVRY